MKKTGHLVQCDLAAVIPFDMFISFGFKPQVEIKERFMLFSHLWIEFLEKNKMLP